MADEKKPRIPKVAAGEFDVLYITRSGGDVRAEVIARGITIDVMTGASANGEAPAARGRSTAKVSIGDCFAAILVLTSRTWRLTSL